MAARIPAAHRERGKGHYVALRRPLEVGKKKDPVTQKLVPDLRPIGAVVPEAFDWPSRNVDARISLGTLAWVPIVQCSKCGHIEEAGSAQKTVVAPQTDLGLGSDHAPHGPSPSVIDGPSSGAASSARANPPRSKAPK